MTARSELPIDPVVLRSKCEVAAHEAGHLTVSLATGGFQSGASIQRCSSYQIGDAYFCWQGMVETALERTALEHLADGTAQAVVEMCEHPLSVSIAGFVAHWRHNSPQGGLSEFIGFMGRVMQEHGPEALWMSVEDMEPFHSHPESDKGLLLLLIEAARAAWCLLDENRYFFTWATAELIAHEEIVEPEARYYFENLSACS